MLRNVCDGIFEYIPITFDEQHFCVTLCTVHSVLMDFRFRPQKLSAQFTTKDDVKSKLEKKDKSDHYGPSNLTEYLFADKNGEVSPKIDAHEINQIYMAYMKSLIDSYERLRAKFNQFHSRCLTEK